MSSLKYSYLLFLPVESGVNRRLILWRRQLCNHSAKDQIIPEHTQIQLPMILSSLTKVNNIGSVVHTHTKQAEKEIQRLWEITLKGKNCGPPSSTGLIALLFFKTHFKKKGKRRIWNMQCSLGQELTLPNCSKYCFTSSTTVLADNPPTNIFFVLVTICKKLQDKHKV